MNSGYVGPQDNRMIPNTFEGVTLHGKVCDVAYDIGYLWDIKPRNLDDFIPMGRAGRRRRLGRGRVVRVDPVDAVECWEFFAGDYYTPDIFNTAFVLREVRRTTSTAATS